MPQELFPDGTPIPDWFFDNTIPTLSSLGKAYHVCDYGVFANENLQTQAFQSLIDTVAQNGGGVLVVPKGVYKTGALFFKQGVHLYLEENAVLLGSDDIADYPLLTTRIEGQTCTYFSALINAENVNGFTIFGKGTIDGNGLRSWKAFWLRKQWNPACTNKDEQRPRLVYISNSANVLLSGVTLQNSHFWTSHIYKCNHVKFINCHILSPNEPVGAPSTDAIDIDACTDALVKNCYMQVNDDAIALKGGKGPWADTLPDNGSNERILIEDCTMGVCHSCLTCGSEAIHNRNIIMRRIQANNSARVLWLKMRPDTPQKYEYICIEGVHGSVGRLIDIEPWTQFYDLQGRKDIPLSYADHISISDCECDCVRYFHVIPETSQYVLSNFTLQNLRITTQIDEFSFDKVDNMIVENVNVQLSN